MTATHTLPPPQRAALHLALAGGFGPAAWAAMARFPDGLAMLKAPVEEARAVLQAPGQFEGWQLARQRFNDGDDAPLVGCLDLLASGMHLVTRDQATYPAALAETADAPLVLMHTGPGALAALDRPCVAIVGTRKASDYGLRLARRMATSLAKAGATVVSGAADGIDHDAHQAAMDAHGKTVAVLGEPLTTRHRSIRRSIAEHGGLVTEMLPGMDQHAGSFARRNRIISGLARAVIIVEGAAGSGTGHTARYAREQGRPMFALPGNVDVPQSHVPNDLIHKGHARPLLNTHEVLAVLGLAAPKAEPADDASTDESAPAVSPTPREQPGGALAPLLAALGQAPAVVDDVAERAGISAAEAARGLLELELKGWARRGAGGMYSRM